MKIAVNTRLLLKDKLEGIGWFSFEMLKRIIKNHPEHEFIFIFDRPFHKDFLFEKNVSVHILSPAARHPFLWYIWFEIRLPSLLKKLKPDIFLSMDGYIPLNTSIPLVNVIHDINFLHRPADLPFFSRKYYNHFFPLFARKADALLTVSEFSRKDIAKNYQLEESKIELVYNGIKKEFIPLNTNEIDDFRSNYSDSLPYFIFVGSLHPRKNVETLLRAYDFFRTKFNHEFRLLITGEEMFMAENIRRIYSQMLFKKEVVFTGRLSSEKLSKAIAASFAMVFIPFFEGFGVPVIEAMACGVPVIASDVTSLPEVCGEAALLVNPDDTEEVADKMIQLYDDENLRKELISKGFSNIQRFSWDTSAEKLWEIIEKTAKHA
jgi:glycosyltransferase involved in cell wall biosynthesis